MRLRYHEAAEEELLDEIGYLEAQAPGLGHRSRRGPAVTVQRLQEEQLQRLVATQRLRSYR